MNAFLDDPVIAANKRVRTRNLRPWATALGALLIVFILLSLLRILGTPEGGLLNPNNPRPSGGKALAELLRQQGVEVTKITSQAELERLAGADTTVLVTDGNAYNANYDAVLIDTPADVVMVTHNAPGFLNEEGNHRLSLTKTTDKISTPHCDDTDAVASARVSAESYFYIEADAPVTMCFPLGDDPAAQVAAGSNFKTGVLVRWTINGYPRAAISEPAMFTNAELADHGHAALGMRLLGKHKTLLWYTPGAQTTPSFLTYSPQWYRSIMWLLLFVAAVGVVWKFPRFGPVASERLPVVVKGGEIVRGVGRLYQRNRDFPHAASLLQQATVRRLATHLGVSTQPNLDALLGTVAQRSPRSAAEINHLLVERSATSARELTELAQQLAQLESEVHLR